ncbi:HDOD domain-containing protein [Inmirania thermothiophila]|uniref:Putative nucleotidyltransferase with HDIG domain n=1 Tax=Inmirania thermothiophila TaxID=1750597 RepID=A0A3N1Y1L1_9GAMM|nr:HDOD domain-containing protein [Inmirania thermothiophila]ROR32714.1 putative nucleotidyltransferase with HDIG domain [Inmirania thermothiophila]
MKTGVILEELEQGVQRLPSLSLVVQEVLRLLDRDDADFAAIEHKLSQDQALAARVLRVANSPFYGMPREITSIHEATVLLGTHTIRNVVTTAGIIGLFPPEAGGALDRVGLWQHAIGVGVASQVLGRRVGLERETAFTAGLLHDIGKLVLDTLFEPLYRRVVRRCAEADLPFIEAEREVLGIDHAEVGRRVAEHWRLPPVIVAAVAGHHAPGDAPEAAVVHVADAMTRALEIGNGGCDRVPAPDEAAWRRLGLGEQEALACLREIDALNRSANLFL